MGEFLESNQAQSHRTGPRHSFPFSAIGNEPGAKGLPAEGLMFVNLGTPERGEIFVDPRGSPWRTHSVGEILF